MGVLLYLLDYLKLSNKRRTSNTVHAFFILKRTSKFWPSFVVLKILHNLSLNFS